MPLLCKDKHIRDAFTASQDSFSTHPKLVKNLRDYYDSTDQDKFFDNFIDTLLVPISGLTERSIFVDRTLDFVAKFACSFIKSKESNNAGGEKEKESNDTETEDDDEEEEFPVFLHRLFAWLLNHHDVEGVDFRLRVCQLLNRLLKYMGDEACIDDELFNRIYYGMLERLKDRVADIRSQAVTALQRLQDPKDENCPIIKAYLFHLAHDPNSVVRRTIVRCIGATKLTLPHVLERTRDVDDGVRRQAYKFLAEKVHIKSLTIGQREGVLQRGLKDRSEGAKKVVEKDLIPSWLRLSNNNVIQLLRHLDVGNSEQNFEGGKLTSAPAGALNVLFNDISFNDLVAQFQYLDERKLIPVEKLTPETALYWRVLVEYLSKEADDELVDRLRPELTPFCNYIREFILAQTRKEEDDLNWEFIAKELFIMCSFYDFGDEVGRRHLVKLIKDMLIFDRLTSSLIPQLIYIFSLVERSPQSRVDQVAEVIAELKDPMSSKEPSKVLDPSAEVVDSNIDHKLIRSLQLEIAKIRVELSTQRDDLENAISAQEFLEAQQIKQKIGELTSKQTDLEDQIHQEQSKGIVAETLTEETASEDVDDPAVTLRSLKLLVAVMQDPAITVLNATLHTLLEEIVVVSVKSTIASIRKEAILALACFCLRSIENSRTHMLLLLQAAHIDVVEVRIAAITAVIDLLIRHGLEAFITAAATAGGSGSHSADNSGTEAELSETGSSIDTALESDMATRGASLTQSELNSQGGNSVVAILSKMLDEPDLDLRTEVAEGLCKLLMIGAISSPKLLSRLLLMWYNPMTESESRLRHILGTFFPLYASMNKSHQIALESAFIPTMKVLFDAPITSPLAEIDTEDVGMFFVHLTREDMLQSYEAPKATLEEESSVSSVHDSLAFTVCNEILSAPDSFQTKTLIKVLSNLQVTSNNFVSLRELKVLSEQLLQHVKEKLCRKTLEKFDRNITDWLARDPAKNTNDNPEKRPAAESLEDVNDTLSTPGKKKRILFSETTLGNPLLDPDQMDHDAEEEVQPLKELSPRKIPSPVVLTNRVSMTTEEEEESGSSGRELNSIVTSTQDLEINRTEEEQLQQLGSSSEASLVIETGSMENGVEDSSEDSSQSQQGSDNVKVVPATPETASEPSSEAESFHSAVDDTPTPPRRRSRSLLSGSASRRPVRKPGNSRSPAPGSQSPAPGSSPDVRSRRRVPPRPVTPDRAKTRPAPEVPQSPGFSRSGRKNSPRIDYRTGREINSDVESSPTKQSMTSPKKTAPSKPTLKTKSPRKRPSTQSPSKGGRNNSPAFKTKSPRTAPTGGGSAAKTAGKTPSSALSGIRPLRTRNSVGDVGASPSVRKSKRTTAKK